MTLKGTQVIDKKLMDSALSEFQKKAEKKFLSGIKEHNPNGEKGMLVMDFSKRISSAKEEVMDLWFYLCSIEEWLTGDIQDELTPEEEQDLDIAIKLQNG